MSSPAAPRIARLVGHLREVFEDASGIELGDGDLATNFIELGLDSLFLTQVALAVQNKMGVKVTFRQLLEQVPTIQELAEHIDRQLPADPTPAPPPPSPAAVAAPAPTTPAAPTVAAPWTSPTPATSRAAQGTIQWVIEQQLQLMAKQLAFLQGSAPVFEQTSRSVVAVPPVAAASSPQAPAPSAPPARPATEPPAAASEEVEITKKPFGAIARISLHSEELTPIQSARLEALVRRYTSRTKTSKQWTEENRSTMADPRVVSGFRPAIKELVYPIVIKRSLGTRLWDLDGNEFIDVLMGFGCNMFGWQPDFVVKAVEEQLRTGYEIGPQTTLAGECAKLVCEFTGFDRAAFCSTGSEAVMGTMRIARTVTGRSRIALFTGSYHGIFDEVIVRGTKKLKAIPAAPGIMRSTSENVLVLD